MDHLRAYAARALVVFQYEPSYFSVPCHLFTDMLILLYCTYT